MSEVVSREVHLVSRPDGMPVAEVEKRLAWSKGEILVRNLYMSIDPARKDLLLTSSPIYATSSCVT